jgi:cytochrome c peroxidase
MKKSFLLSGLAGAALLFAAACTDDPTKIEGYYYTEKEFEVISRSLNLPELPEKYTANLPQHLTNSGLSAPIINSDEATLGRVLFYDKNLSSDGTISCASCHKQEIGFSDDRRVSVGVESREGTRNSIALSSVANFAAYYGSDLNGPGGIPFFWDNRAATASQQNIGSMTNPLEMNMQAHEIVDAVKGKDYYEPLFRKAFGDSQITSERVSQAIAAFVNAMGSYRSRFDDAANTQPNGWANYESTFSKFSAAENRGKAIYNSNCASCHSSNFGRPVKIYSNNGLDVATSDKGVGGISGSSAEMGTFKVPTLRNIAITGPYMHDGRFNTLEEVIEHYSTGIKDHPNLGSELRSSSSPVRMNFSAQDKQDLIAFLNTLTDEEFRKDTRFSNPFK